MTSATQLFSGFPNSGWLLSSIILKSQLLSRKTKRTACNTWINSKWKSLKTSNLDTASNCFSKKIHILTMSFDQGIPPGLQWWSSLSKYSNPMERRHGSGSQICTKSRGSIRNGQKQQKKSRSTTKDLFYMVLRQWRPLRWRDCRSH